MLVHLLAPDRDAPGASRPMIWSYPKYRVFRDHQQAFESTVGVHAWNWNLTGAGAPEQVAGELVDGTYSPLLGVAPQLGRPFSTEETRGARFARWWCSVTASGSDRFGGDPAVLGRTIGLNGDAATRSSACCPQGSAGSPGRAELFVPVTTQSAADLEEKWNHSYLVVARRKADVSVEQAQRRPRTLGGGREPRDRRAAVGPERRPRAGARRPFR